MISVMAALVLAQAAPAQRWLPLGGSDSGEVYRDYLDTASISRAGPTVTLWTRRDFAAGQRTAWHEVEVDCAKKRDSILAFVQDEAGTVSHNVVRPHRPSAPIAANSLGERIFQIVCR